MHTARTTTLWIILQNYGYGSNQPPGRGDGADTWLGGLWRGERCMSVRRVENLFAGLDVPKT